MAYFKFISESVNADNEVNTTMKEFHEEYLYDVLDQIEMFLRGCGFAFNGKLDFVQEDEDCYDEHCYEREPLDLYGSNNPHYPYMENVPVETSEK